MANGFQLHTTGGHNYPSPGRYDVAGTTNINLGLFHGDLVRYDGTDTDKISDLVAADGNACIGAVASLMDSNDFPVLYIPAASALGYQALVWDDPTLLFTCLSDVLFDPEADLGATADHIAGSGGSSTTGMSSHELADKGQAQCLIVDWLRRPGVAATGAAARIVIVRLNEHANL